MIVQHTLELLRYHRKLVVAIVLLVSVSAAGISVFRLFASPKYLASASVAVLPTEAEYTFGRETSGGARNTARGLAATYMEYLKSRPVVEAALAKVTDAKGEDEAPPPPSVIIRTIKSSIGFARRIYRTLDSGKYVPSTPHDRAVGRLMKAIDLHKVADSYILKIEVRLDNPEAAAAAANALAEAYVERVSQQLATSAGEIGGFLQQQISEREEELNELLAEEEKLKAGLGVSSIEEERGHLLAERETARQKLLDAQEELDAADTAVQVLDKVDLAQSGRNLSELSQERAAASGRLQAANKNFLLRQQSVEKINRSLAALRSKEEPLLQVARQRELTKIELTELQSRLLSTHLTRSSSMSQVRVIDPALAPAYPDSPRVVKNTVAGLLAGLLLAVFSVFVIDTLSGTVKTSADLERLVGARCLATFPKGLVSRTSEPGPLEEDRGADPRLQSIGGELERGLAVLRAFEAPSIQVTGFLQSTRLSDTAVTLGTALASQGRRVICTLTDQIASATFTRKIVGDELRLVAPAAEVQHTAADSSDEAADVDIRHWSRPDSERQIRIKCLQPVSAELLLNDAARRSPVLVCAVPAGEVLERDVQDLQQRATEAGIRAVCFVLVTA